MNHLFIYNEFKYCTYGENEEKLNKHSAKWQNTSHQCSERKIGKLQIIVQNGKVYNRKKSATVFACVHPSYEVQGF